MPACFDHHGLDYTRAHHHDGPGRPARLGGSHHSDRAVRPERMFASEEDLADPNMNHLLRVVSVKPDGAAAAAGIGVHDNVIAVRKPADANTARCRFRDARAARGRTGRFNALCRYRPPGCDRYGKKNFHARRCRKRPLYADYARKAVAIMPEGTSQKNREQAILFLMVVLTVVTFIRCLCRFLQLSRRQSSCANSKNRSSPSRSSKY